MLLSLSWLSIHWKPGLREIELVQGRALAIGAVQVGDPALQPRVLGTVRELPVELAIVVPLAPLPELAAHEEQLLARMRPHVAQQQAQVGELLPAVAGHLRDERLLAVHHLVVRQRQHEVLEERVPDRERQPVVVVPAMDRLLAHVIERVVHPAHVPFHREAQAAPRTPAARPSATRSIPRRWCACRESRGPRRRSAASGTRSRRGSPCRRARWGSTRRPCGRSRGRASRRPRPRAARRCGTCRARKARST